MSEVKLVELLLTAEIYNKFNELSEDDIPKEIRKLFYGKNKISRPLAVKQDVALKYVGKFDNFIKKLPFIDFNTFTKQLKLTSLEIATKWFAHKGIELIKNNPVLAYYYENYDSLNVSYQEAKKRNKPKYSDREWLKSVIAELEKDEETAEMLGLVRVFSPEDIKIDFDDVVLDKEQ